MNRAKIALIIRREYLESVRKKSFLFGLVATPAIFAAAMFLPLLAGGMFAEDHVTLGVIDGTGVYGERLRESLAAEEDAGARAFRPELQVWSPETAPHPEALRDAVASGSLAGWIELPADFERSGEFRFHAESVLDLATVENLQNRIGGLLAERRAAEAGLTREQVDEIVRPVELRVFRIGSDTAAADPERLYLKSVMMVMMMFFALLPTGQILMRSVIEEKSNRVVEVLLASVTPQEMMVGKIIGLGAVGLTMLGCWAVAGSLLTLQTGGTLPIGGAEAGIFLLYFVPGYFLYAALLGAIGSVCSQERDAQPFLTPISLMLVMPVLLGIAIAQNPDHLVARVLSFVPFFTPSLMLFRFTIQPPPAWEIAATWTTLVLGTAAMFWTASRVFRTGILMTGKRPTLPEIARWIGATPS